jgi:hypothetical protein
MGDEETTGQAPADDTAQTPAGAPAEPEPEPQQPAPDQDDDGVAKPDTTYEI